MNSLEIFSHETTHVMKVFWNYEMHTDSLWYSYFFYNCYCQRIAFLSFMLKQSEVLNTRLIWFLSFYYLSILKEHCRLAFCLIQWVNIMCQILLGAKPTSGCPKSGEGDKRLHRTIQMVFNNYYGKTKRSRRVNNMRHNIFWGLGEILPEEVIFKLKVK